MAKRNSSPVVIDKKKFLLPKMEFFAVDEATGEGFYLRELSGKALLEFKEAVEQVRKSAGSEAELQTYQAVQLMAKFVQLSACDKNGHPFFNEDDLGLLTEKNPNLLVEIANRAMPMSGISPAALNEVAVDLKNAQPASSTTN